MQNKIEAEQQELEREVDAIVAAQEAAAERERNCVAPFLQRCAKAAECCFAPPVVRVVAVEPERAGASSSRAGAEQF